MICLNRKILIQEGRQLNSNEFLIHLSQIPLNHQSQLSCEQNPISLQFSKYILPFLLSQVQEDLQNSSPLEPTRSSKKSSKKRKRSKNRDKFEKKIRTKKKRPLRKVSLMIGIILIIIGIIIGFTLLPIITKTPRQMQEDMDYKEQGWKSYKSGDEIIIRGKITHEKRFYETNRGEELGYTIDNELKIISKKDIGNIGDKIIINCKVKEMSDPSVNNGTPFEYLKANSIISPYIFYLPGIIILILGEILIFISFIRTNPK